MNPIILLVALFVPSLLTLTCHRLAVGPVRRTRR